MISPITPKTNVKVVEIERRDILFIGDNLTESDKRVTTYATLIKQGNKGLKIDILAYSGRRTEWMRTMVESTLKSIQYERVYIYGGINDMHSDGDVLSAVSNIQRIVDMVNDSGGIPIVIVGYDSASMSETGVGKPHKWVKSKNLDSKYHEYQTLLEKSLRGGIILPPIKLNTSDMFQDRIHPNKIGHQKLMNYIHPTLRWSRSHPLYIPYDITILNIPIHPTMMMEIPLPKLFTPDTTKAWISSSGFRYGYNHYEFEFWRWRKSLWDRIWRRK
jgi:hypothetical protein